MDLSLLAAFKFDNLAQKKSETRDKNHSNNHKHAILFDIYIKEHKKLLKNRSRNSERNHSAPCDSADLDVCDRGLIVTNVKCRILRL